MKDDYKERIINVIKDNSMQVNKRNLIRYLKFLEKNIKMPCYLYGNEYFMVEDPVLYENWNIYKYENLKFVKNKAVLELIKFDKDDFEDLTNDDLNETGIRFEAKHISDNEWENGDVFILRLFEFIAKDNDNFQIFDDYAKWILNYSTYFKNISKYTIW